MLGPLRTLQNTFELCISGFVFPVTPNDLFHSPGRLGFCCPLFQGLNACF